MNLLTANNKVQMLLAGKQDPDEVTFTKQWSEHGQLKGWMVKCSWLHDEDPLVITYDITQGYSRVIGDINRVPNFIKGKHQTKF